MCLRLKEGEGHHPPTLPYTKPNQPQQELLQFNRDKYI